MSIRDLKIDMEFASKIPPLTGEELMRLHESILTEGRCISPIVVWDGLIVDGHNRYRFLSRHPEIEYEVYEKDFADRNDAIAWICKNQLGRRNLTPEQKKYLIGKQYEAEKQALGGDRKSEVAKSMYQNETLIERENTGERIARENNISRISVIRAEKYANAVDLAEEAMPGIKDEILSGAIHATDTEIIKIANTTPDKRPAIVEKLREPKPPKAQKPPREKMTFNPKHYEKHTQKHDQKPLTVSGILCDIGEAADMFIITWAKLQREYSDFFAPRRNGHRGKEIYRRNPRVYANRRRIPCKTQHTGKLSILSFPSFPSGKVPSRHFAAIQTERTIYGRTKESN